MLSMVEEGRGYWVEWRQGMVMDYPQPHHKPPIHNKKA
ncbi:unnamed protein product [Brassica oleracea]